MSQPPEQSWQRQTSSPTPSAYRYNHPPSSLPPGAMASAMTPKSQHLPIQPSVPSRPQAGYSNGHTGYGDYQRTPSGGYAESGAAPAMDYRTASAVEYGGSTSSRRPLPTMPVATPPTALPSTSSSSSMGQPRRSLPTPPSVPPQSGLPSVPSRPSGRVLPALPPVNPGSSRSTSNSMLPNDSAPPPPPRPLPEPTGYSPSPPSTRVVSQPKPPQKPSLPYDRQSSDRFTDPQRTFTDSPPAMTASASTPSYFAGPSRSPTQSSSYSHRQPISTSSSSLGHSSSMSSTHTRPSTTLSHAYTAETAQTSLAPSTEDQQEWKSILEGLGEDGDGESTLSTNVTVQPPASPGFGSDGRGTPTPGHYRREPPNIADLNLESRASHTSSSSLGAIDAGLPATPRVVPERVLRNQRSFVGDVAFPVPHAAQPQYGEGSMSRNSSTSGFANTSPARSSHDTREQTPKRHPSTRSSLFPLSESSTHPPSTELSPSWAQQSQAPSNWVQTKLQIHQSHRIELDEDGSMRRESYDNFDYEEEEEWEEEDEVEVEGIRFFQPAFLSEAALQLRDRVERRRQTKAGIAWVGSFTGRDIVTTIQSFLPGYTRDGPNDRRFALITAQSLQNQLWFVEVDWDIKPLRDSSEDVFRFMGEMEGMGAGVAGEGLNSELPSGLMAMATKCYSPSCTSDHRCYSPRCPHRVSPDSFLGRKQATPAPTPSVRKGGNWQEEVDPLLLRSLSEQQINRQNIIRQAIQSEIHYEADLASVSKLFVEGLRDANPPVIDPERREMFILEVFTNLDELHEACKRLVDHFAIRERESTQRPLILSVGDIFLQAAADFRMIYPEYTGSLPNAELVLKRELENNADFRLFCERIVRENDRRQEIKYLIARPSTQLQRYPAVLEAILNATSEDDPDRDFLVEALSSIQNLSAISQLKLFHASKGRGPAGKMQWFDLVPEDVRNIMEKKEQKRQMQIWELIQGEMEYVADLETIDELFVRGIRTAIDKVIIERPRVETFLDDAFHNYRSLLEVHSRLLENLQFRQLEQHPNFGMISDLVLDAALNWQDAYMEYVTHYPIAKIKVQEEIARNANFRDFLDACLKDPRSNRQDIYHFINRPIPRLLRYNLLLSDILKSLKEVGPDNHPDIETIPQIIELVGDLGKATQKGVAVNESKVELWGLQSTLDGGKAGSRAVKDLEMLNPMRELIHRGRVYRQPESIGSSWSELVVLLFDNYLVLAKPERQSRSSRRESRKVRYIINRRPIPLELLSLGNFADAPRNRNNKIFSVSSSHEPDSNNPDTASGDSRTVWPFSISFIGQGQLGGQYTLWTDSYGTRAEWQEKLLHAKVLRTEVNDANKVFEMTPLSEGTFWMASNYATPAREESGFTGRVTCSVPFITADGRNLVAVGCDEGVWIGLRHDSKSLRKVLHVKAVTNIAVLEEFGMFLVLQDKSLLAYHLEALVPSASSPQVRAAPQRLSPGKDIAFFTVGQLSGRTLVLYMKKKGMDSLFRVLEPILGRNAEDAARQRRPFGNFLGQRTEWFRLYKDFFIPTEALNVHFLKHKLAVVCGKGFEIMDLTDLKGGSIPIFDPAKVRDRPQLADLQKRCDTTKPLGMFRSTETEFLLCYESFGLYVDRHGEPNRDSQAIEWEGKPDSVAFHPPYLLLVSAPFIEIRHIDTAKLVQIYTGSDMRLTWDGTGGMLKPFVDNPGPNGYGDETSSQEPRIHICRRPEDPRRARGPSQGIGQNVFELTPTLLLNNPLLNPVHTHDANYFPPAPPMTNRPSSIITTNSLSDGYQFGNMNGFAPASERSWG